VALTAVMVVCTAASVLAPKNIDLMGTPFSQWMLILQYVMIGGSIVFWILLLVSGKEKRRAYGLNSNQWGTSVLMILLFIGLYLLRLVIASALGGQLSEFGKIMANPTTWIMFFTVLLNFFLAVVAFFGEEYGWRYYLQPLLQKHFGLKGGVILLGCVWAVWHLPIDFFYYTTPDMGLAALASQFVTCITLGLFMAYAYMKTQNIWVPVIIHFLNNNMAVVFSGTYSTEVLQNQQIHWADIPAALVLNLLIFGWVIFMKPFKEKKEENILQ
jgi:CAAX amino terminal protease family.